MKSLTSRLSLGGLLLLWCAPAFGAIGGEYSLLSFKPWLDRGYNTRMGWQGYPVSTADPHLYLHTRGSQALLSELEYLSSNGRIHTQIFKVYGPAGRLDAQHWRELEYFAFEAGGGSLDPQMLKSWVAHSTCHGERRHGGFYMTLIVDPKATWLRISDHGSATNGLKPCLDQVSK